MAIQDDFTINYTAKTVTHTSGSTVYTAQALYSWLQDTFDEAGQMDDSVPMSAQTPTDFTLINGWDIPEASYQYINGGSVDDSTNNDLYSNFETIGGIVASTEMYLIQNGTKLTDYWGTGHIDLDVLTKNSGTLIDSGNVSVFARDFGDTYDFFTSNLSAGGRTSIPIATALDINITIAEATVAGFNDIAITFGTVSKDLNNGNGAQNYDVVIDCAGRTLSQVYHYLQYVTRSGSVLSLNSVDGEQYVSADASYTPLKSAPFGSFAGGKFFGVRGVWIENYASSDSSNFQLTDASNVTQTPPLLVSIQVTGLLAGDRVFVPRLTGVGGTIDGSEYTISTATSGASTITVSTSIVSDTPATGTLRIGDEVLAYTSFTGGVFTMSTALTATYTGDLYVPFIDETATGAVASTTVQYTSDIPVLIRVRKKGIQPFEVESLITSSGLSVGAIRTTDNVVT